MILLLIEEEYGYRDWRAVVSEERYAELYVRFCEMQPTLTCLVPVTDIVPEAVEGSSSYELNGVVYYVVGDREVPDTEIRIRHAHFHEADDSWMEDL